MKSITNLKVLGFLVLLSTAVAFAGSSVDSSSSDDLEIVMVPISTTIENDVLTMIVDLKIINHSGVLIRKVVAKATEVAGLEVSPREVAVGEIKPQCSVVASRPIKLIYSIPSQDSGNMGQELTWDIEYVAPGDVVKAVKLTVGAGKKKPEEGKPTLAISEIMFYPADPGKEPEWVELYNSSTDKAIDIGGYDICNASGTVYTLPQTREPVPPGAFILVVFDGKDSAKDDPSFKSDNLVTFHANKRNVFDDEGDLCVVFSGKSRSRKSMCSFVHWGQIKETAKDKERPKKAKKFLKDATAKKLWKKEAVRVFAHDPQITGPIAIVNKGGSLVLVKSNGTNSLRKAASPCPPKDVTPGKKNTLPAPQLWLPRDELQTSASVFTFSWLPVGVSTYHLQICNDEECADPIVEVKGLSQPRFRPTSPLGKDVVYYWRIRCISGKQVSSWSEVRKFTIGYPEMSRSAPFDDSSTVVVLAVGGPLGVGSRASRKDSLLLCVDGCDEAHWDTDNSSGTQHAHSIWYCWAAAAQMLGWYRGGTVLQDEIVATVKGGGGVDPEDSLPHGSGAGAFQSEDYHAVRYALQATQTQLHEQTSKPSETELKAFIDADRPLWYENVGHAMIIDGYRTVGGVLEARFLNTDNDGTVAWRPWNAEPFRWCLAPEAGLTGMTSDSRMTTDSDSDGMMDFDEDERFPTAKNDSDSDNDGVPDKPDVASYALRSIDADVDTDSLRGEVDDDSDDGGLKDGIEDLDHDGKYEPADDETDPHDPSDDLRIDLIFCIDTTGSMWDDIAAVKVSAVAIINQVATDIPGFRIAVVDYRDFPVWPYGGAGDYAYHDVLGFTDDSSDAVSAIQSLSLGWGADWQESVYSALMHCISSTSLGGWRGEPIKKTIILMGDAPPHDPEPFTGYTMSSVVQAAEDADPVIVFPIAIGGDTTTMAYFSGIADGTGGEVFTAASASEVVEAILEAIETITYSPYADAGGPYTGAVGVPLTFDGSGSFDPDGEIVLYEWDWDADGIYDESTSLPSCEHTWDVPYDGIVRMRVTDNDSLSSVDTAMVTVVDTTPPTVQVVVPSPGISVQDGVIFKAEASDASGVTQVYFYLREPDGASGTPIGHEDLAATLNTTSGKWELPFDTTVVLDGHYVILAKAIDTYGNEGWSEVVQFSIRNWAVLELLPATQSNKGGRTMPVKFSLRIAEAVDPTMPFVYNEQLEIRIYQSTNPDKILQTSLFGDRSTDYRISTVAEFYITNFKTKKQPAEYIVEIWRTSKNFLVGSFTFETVK